MTITAIPTEYAGCTFRSRLEARWAVFFDAMRIEWQYEPEGFQLQAGKYLPDFYLPQHGCFAEVKPQWLNAREQGVAEDLVRTTEKPIIVLFGPPDFKGYEMLFKNPDIGSDFWGDDVVVGDLCWMVNRGPGKFWMDLTDGCFVSHHALDRGTTPNERAESFPTDYQDAIRMSKAARFEKRRRRDTGGYL